MFIRHNKRTGMRKVNFLLEHTVVVPGTTSELERLASSIQMIEIMIFLRIYYEYLLINPLLSEYIPT